MPASRRRWPAGASPFQPGVMPVRRATPASSASWSSATGVRALAAARRHEAVRGGRTADAGPTTRWRGWSSSCAWRTSRTMSGPSCGPARSAGPCSDAFWTAGRTRTCATPPRRCSRMAVHLGVRARRADAVKIRLKHALSTAALWVVHMRRVTPATVHHVALGRLRTPPRVRNETCSRSTRLGARACPRASNPAEPPRCSTRSPPSTSTPSTSSTPGNASL